MAELKKYKMLYFVIWASMFFACLVYSQVPRFMTFEKKAQAELDMIIVYAVAGMSLAIFLAGIAYFLYSAAPDKLKQYGDIKISLAKLQAAAITSIAMFESISVFGLTLIFIGFSYKYALPFFVASPVGLLIQLAMTLRVFGALESDPRSLIQK